MAYFAASMSSTILPLSHLEKGIRNIPNFPKPGIQFKDITPLLADAELFSAAIDHLIAPHRNKGIKAVVGIDARGFILGGAAAIKLNCGFVPIRKKGKLPYETFNESYDLEYGSNAVEVHVDAVTAGTKILLIDDLLATGGTAAAAANLLEKIGAELVEIAFLVELGFLNGRQKLSKFPVRSLITY